MSLMEESCRGVAKVAAVRTEIGADAEGGVITARKRGSRSLQVLVAAKLLLRKCGVWRMSVLARCIDIIRWHSLEMDGGNLDLLNKMAFNLLYGQYPPLRNKDKRTLLDSFADTGIGHGSSLSH